MLSMYLALVDTENGRILFETIYYSFQQQMFHVAYHIVKNTQLAEDAVQDALLGIAKTVDKIHFNGDKELRAYVFTATKRAAVAIKKSEDKKAEAFEDFQYSARTYDDDAYANCSNKEVLVKVLSLIEQLPTHYREVLFYSSVYDMNCALIGELLDRPAATVRKQLSRARAMLVEMCAKEGLELENQ